MYSSNSFKYVDVRELILFLNVFTGCDTTSCFYKQGKNKLIRILSNNSELQKLAKMFYNPNACVQSIGENGIELAAALYRTKNEKNNLSNLRFLHFQKSTLKKIFKLESLPPTDGAARQHALRVFYQIQLWLGCYVRRRILKFHFKSDIS